MHPKVSCNFGRAVSPVNHLPCVLEFYNIYATEINTARKPAQICFILKYADELPTEATFFDERVHLCLTAPGHFTQVLEPVLFPLVLSVNLG